MPLPFPNSCQLACAAWLGGGMPHWQHGKARICLSLFDTISPQKAVIKLFIFTAFIVPYAPSNAYHHLTLLSQFIQSLVNASQATGNNSLIILPAR